MLNKDKSVNNKQPLKNNSPNNPSKDNPNNNNPLEDKLIEITNDTPVI